LRVLAGGLLQHRLVRGVVVDHPFPPEFGSRIEVELQPAPAAARYAQASGGGIEGGPAVPGNVRFHPGVRIAGSDQVASRKVIELAAAEAIDDAGGNAL